jgi:hypothetical protein
MVKMTVKNFDVEALITKGTYIKIRKIGKNLIDELPIDTNDSQIFLFALLYIYIQNRERYQFLEVD